MVAISLLWAINAQRKVAVKCGADSTRKPQWLQDGLSSLPASSSSLSHGWLGPSMELAHTPWNCRLHMSDCVPAQEPSLLLAQASAIVVELGTHHTTSIATSTDTFCIVMATEKGNHHYCLRPGHLIFLRAPWAPTSSCVGASCLAQKHFHPLLSQSRFASAVRLFALAGSFGVHEATRERESLNVFAHLLATSYKLTWSNCP